jgi:hypothetical protein
MKDIKWGTSSSIASNKYETKHLFLLLWNCFILSGIIFNFYTNNYKITDIIAISSVFGYGLQQLPEFLIFSYNFY